LARIHDAVVQYLAGHRWPYEDHGHYLAVPVPMNEARGPLLAYFVVDEDDELLLVHTPVPAEIAADRRAAVALYLTRANYGLPIGNFEMDLDSGELRYKASVDVSGTEINDAVIDHLFLASVTALEHYAGGARAVADGGDPAEWAAAADAE
jgi:hypothetical protein